MRAPAIKRVERSVHIEDGDVAFVCDNVMQWPGDSLSTVSGLLEFVHLCHLLM